MPLVLDGQVTSSEINAKYKSDLPAVLSTGLLEELLGLLKAEGCDVVKTEIQKAAAIKEGKGEEKEDGDVGVLSLVRPQDVLFVIDMQTDFLPGGSFGVAEGDSTLPEITRLMVDVFPFTNLVFATRDYHPVDHCSFNAYGGPFPAHCVQGSKGSFLHPMIGEAVHARGKDNTSVVFKGFSEDIDSFGAVGYCDETADQRLCHNPSGAACSSAWTGSFVLKCSNIEKDVNAPPDYTAVLYRKDVMDVVRERTKAFREKKASQASATASEGSAKEEDDTPDAYICGLAFDFCVLDTALNGRKSGAFRNIYIVVNASRAAHIPSIGQFGSGFLSSPKDIARKLAEANVKLIRL